MIEFAIALVLYRRCRDETNKISDLETSNGKVQQFIQLRNPLDFSSEVTHKRLKTKITNKEI